MLKLKEIVTNLDELVAIITRDHYIEKKRKSKNHYRLICFLPVESQLLV